MKVLLAYPPRSTKVLGMGEDKLGLLYMAAVLRQNDIDVMVYDESGYNTFSGLKKILKSYRPDIFGVSISTPNRIDAFKAAKISKEVLPKSLVIAGGPHVSAVPKDTLENIREIDAVVIGEGERTLLEICKKGINANGVILRKNNKIIANPPREPILNLDELPFPARDILTKYRKKDISQYYLNTEVPGKGILRYYYTTITTGRGCPFNCIFCAVPEIWGRKVRLRSAQNVVHELKEVKERFGVEGFHVCDDTFNITKKRVFDICELMIREKIDMKWNAHLRVDNVDRDILAIMKKAGCYMISFGIESGSQRILDNVIEKKITLDKVRAVIKLCDELKIVRSCNFIYSLPDETNEDVRKTIDLMEEFKGKQVCGPTMILPSSRIEKIAKAKGILPVNFSWSRKTPYRYYDPTSYSFMPLYVEKLPWLDVLNIFYNHVSFQGKKRKKNYIFRLAYRILQVRSFGELKFVILSYIDLVRVFLRNIRRKKQ